MAYKNYIKDSNCRIFDSKVKINQAWKHLSSLLSNNKAVMFTHRMNSYGGKDYYFSVRSENAVYIVSLEKYGQINKIVRF